MTKVTSQQHLDDVIESVADWSCYTPRDLSLEYPLECDLHHCWLHTHKTDIAALTITVGDDKKFDT